MLLIVYVMFCVLIGWVAHGRGRNGAAWGIGSLFITPILAALLLWSLPDLKKQQERTALVLTNRKCPFCAEMVLREAVVCKHCGRDLPPLTAEELAGVPPPPEKSWIQKELGADRELLNSLMGKKPHDNNKRGNS